jgi:predicted CoA-substrate-specific enzyme activase
MREFGFDIGSVSLKLARFTDGELDKTEYLPHRGKPYELLRQLLADLGPDDRLALTGNIPKTLGSILGADVVNEVTAAVEGVLRFRPDARSVIEIGGADSKLILVDGGIKDFSSNTICAAGAGSFLDQQAQRLNFPIAEFGRIALASQNPARIAGRCSVFAKSDLIHLQQIGTPIEDLIAGLCLALARNFKAAICRGKDIPGPVVFIGGVAANEGMVWALRQALDLNGSGIVIPEHFNTVGAIGAALAARKSGTKTNYRGVKDFDAWLGQERIVRRLPPLNGRKKWRPTVLFRTPKTKTRAYLGVDVGSISTNLVLIDEPGNVIARRYLWTRGQPITAVLEGLRDMEKETGALVEVRGVGTTGSGRYLIGELIGADIVKNEITAQARAALEVDPEVDTIFEIGGQDSKFISLRNQTIVDFEMNKVCAAGTGSFLEEQAQALGVKLEEFGDRALDGPAPINLGERCTVFIGSEVVHHQKNQTELDNLLAGLGYSTVFNYLNRVVGTKPIGDRIFFQGGVAANKAVVSAFEETLKKTITIPPNYDVTGAWGVALLARDAGIKNTTFKGFDRALRTHRTETFACRQCSNECEINRIKVDGEKPIFYGGRCERYEAKEKKTGPEWPDYFKMRNEIFFAAEPTPGKAIGIPRALIFYELFPFFYKFLTELGFQPVLSEPTNRRTVETGAGLAAADTCLPVKLALGHIQALLKQGIRQIFLPSVITLPPNNDGFTRSFVCPNVQTIPYVARAAFGEKIEVFAPSLYFDRGPAGVDAALYEFGRQFGKSKKAVAGAIRAGIEHQAAVQRRIEDTGRAVRDRLPETAFVVCARPYNGYDLGLNLDLPRKIRDLGIPALPIDFLPLDFGTLRDDFYNMYWHSGQRILAAAEAIRRDERLFPVYLSNFSCGPDSFLTRFFREKLGKKPSLLIEVDEHSGDAGFVTRCEAFSDSIRSAPRTGTSRTISPASSVAKDRLVYIPDMCDQAKIFAAGMRFAGFRAEVLPFPDETSIMVGRRYTSGRECLPAIITAGDMVKKTRAPDFDPQRSAFFMAQGSGPCRFGQYYKLHRLILDELGLKDVPIYAPNQGPSLFDDLGPLGFKFLLRVWDGICAVDALEAAARRIRPYEKNPGAVDKVYDRALAELTAGIEQGRSVIPVVKNARAELAALGRTAGTKPRIGIVGEIYVRSQKFSNHFIVRRLEELGCEVALPSIAEWFFYTNFTRVRNCAWFGEYRRALFTKGFDLYMRHRQRRIYQTLGLEKEGKVEHLVGRALPHIDPSFEGEAVLSVGKTLEFIAEGYAGVVNVMPFTCMPGNIVTAVYRGLKEKHPDFPMFVLAFDGVDHAVDSMRLETFVNQARDYAARRDA